MVGVNHGIGLLGGVNANIWRTGILANRIQLITLCRNGEASYSVRILAWRGGYVVTVTATASLAENEHQIEGNMPNVLTSSSACCGIRRQFPSSATSILPPLA